MRIFIPLVFAFVLSGASSAYADKVSQNKPPTPFVASEDFYVIEGAGLFQSGSVDALNVEAWQNSSRQDITQMIKDMPANSQNPVVQDMIETILLSESNTNEMRDFENVAPGDDLLTLRVYKLIEGGFYKDALELYSVAIETPHHESIAKAGILSMLSSAQKSIACLEMKTLGQMNMQDDFWPTFTAYCDYTLSEAPSAQARTILENTDYEILRSIAFNETFIFPYTIEGWNSLSLLEQSVLIAEGRVEVPIFDKRLLNTIPPKDMVALLSLETLNEVDRAALSIKAHEYGLVDASDIAKAYLAITDGDIVLGGLPALYKGILETEDPEERNSILVQAIDLADTYGFSAISPFAEDIANSDLTDLSDEQMRAVLWVFYVTNIKISPEIIENYVENSQKNIDSDGFSSNIRAIPLILKTGEGYDLSTNMQNIGIFHKNTQDDDQFDIEQLDNTPYDDDNADKVYEKDVDAAAQKRQDNASGPLLEQLNRASRDNALGETVLLSIKMLSDQSIRDADDDVYSDEIKAFKKAELNEFSRKMAIERLIGE